MLHLLGAAGIELPQLAHRRPSEPRCRDANEVLLECPPVCQVALMSHRSLPDAQDSAFHEQQPLTCFSLTMVHPRLSIMPCRPTWCYEVRPNGLWPMRI